MVSKTTVACCLVVALFVFLETAESQRTCDALVDVTYLIDSSKAGYWENFDSEKEFLKLQVRALLPSKNEVRIRVMTFDSQVRPMEGSVIVSDRGYLYEYGSYEDKDRLEGYLQTVRVIYSGNNVIEGLVKAASPGPKTTCRREHGARRVVVLVADGLDDTWRSASYVRYILESNGVEVLPLTIGDNPILGRIGYYLNPEDNDRTIWLHEAKALTWELIQTMVVDELCKVTPEMKPGVC